MILADTGFLYALSARTDDHHGPCTETFARRRGQFSVPATVVTETCYMLGRVLGVDAEARFLDVLAAGRIPVVDLQTGDYARTAQLVRQYADMNLGTVDASIVAIAERLVVQEIATVNPRDFTVVRPRHVDHFVLLP